MARLLFAVIVSLLLPARLPAQDVQVHVSAGDVLRPVNRLLYGINTARWDESLFPGPSDAMLLSCDRDAIAKIAASGVTVLKYPGGNDADSYVWNSAGNNPLEMNTDEYIALCRQVGAEPFITVNFNAPPDLAASWVRYCNRERGYAVRYWEVGDEQWGKWAKGHTTPEQYAAKYAGFVRAMREVDPTIKVATNVPLGPDPEGWTRRVLMAAGEAIDMLTFTFYPQQWGQEDDDTLLASVDLYRRQFLELRARVEMAVGPARTSSLLFVNVGYNSVNHSPGPQTLQLVNALWVAEMLGAMAETGIDIACYWAVHNAFPPRTGDYGYLSSEGSNTPSYSYDVFPMFTRHFGTTLVRSSSSDRSVSVFASSRGKLLSLFLINTGRGNPQTARVSIDGFEPAPASTMWVLDQNRRNELIDGPRDVSRTFALELPPFSLSVLEIIRNDSLPPPRNLARDATPAASSFSTIGPHFVPGSATDGIHFTRWNSAAWTKSNGEEEQWFQLAWGQVQRLSSVRIHWGETHAVRYRLEASGDGVRWETLTEVTEGHGGVEERSWVPVTAQFLRLYGLCGTPGISAYSIREIEVY